MSIADFGLGIAEFPLSRDRVVGDRRARRASSRCARPTRGGASPRWASAATGRSTRSEEHRLNSSHSQISYAVFCLKKKKTNSLVVQLTPRKLMHPRLA